MNQIPDETTKVDANPNRPAHTRKVSVFKAIIGWIFGLALLFLIIFVLRQWQLSHFGPLQRAAYDGNYTRVKSLIEKDISPNQQCDFNDWTALHAAAATGNFKIAEYLIEHGADVNIRDKDGFTPLHNTADSFTKGEPKKSTEDDRNKIALLLLQHGANVNSTTNFGETPLHRAIHPNNVELVNILLKNGADPNARQGQNMTPLHFAFSADQNRSQIIQLLVAYGANSKIPDEQGNTPKDLAEKYHPNFVVLLKK